MAAELRNESFIGRLLEEVSWEKATSYREGGRRRENVLTAEVFLPLSYLPRTTFLGGVLRTAHGADSARRAAIAEIESTEVMLLPDEFAPMPGIRVQPDAHLSSKTSYVLVEAKRNGRSSFQPAQLAKEFLAVRSVAGDRSALLLLVLGSPPPVTVKGLGAMDPTEAVAAFPGLFFGETPPDAAALETFKHEVERTIAWITWAEIAEETGRQLELFWTEGHDASVGATVQRLAESVVRAVRWHS